MVRGMFIAAACVMAAGTAVAQEKYPKLHAALHELREARSELKASKRVGPKKEAAVQAINEAIASLKVCLDIKGDDYKGTDRDRDRGKKFKDHPRVRAAIEDLRDARRELTEARNDFRGHKRKAIKDIDHAIDVLQDVLK
ncbi:MAG: hypothetical protein ACRC33_22000 [Gemmataceae bacterium]